MKLRLTRFAVVAFAVAGFLTLSPRASADTLSGIVVLEYKGNDGIFANQATLNGTATNPNFFPTPLGQFNWGDPPGLPNQTIINTFCAELTNTNLPNIGSPAAFQVSDLKRSIAWYRDVLGFTLLYEVAEIGWAELATETTKVNIGVSQVEKPKSAGGGAVPTFGVVDIDAARANLESRKVRFDGPTQEIPGMVKLATFFDPDGNALMLFQDLSGH